MNARFLTIASLILLTACGDSRDNKGEKKGGGFTNTAFAADESVHPLAGLWESTVKLENLAISGLPAAAAANMKKSYQAGLKDSEYCLSEADASKPPEAFFAGNDVPCNYQNFSMKDGAISGAFTCQHQAGMVQHVRMNGRYTKASYDLRMETKITGKNSPVTQMVMTVQAKRLGDCPAQ